MLDTLIVAGLVVVWGWVLGKPFLANMAGSLRRDPVGAFNRQLDVLARAPHQSLGMGGLVPPARRTSRRQAARRRQVFLALVISVVTSLLLAVAFGGVFVTLHVLMDLLLVGFLGLAATVGGRRVQRSATVVQLRPGRDVPLQPRYARVAGER